MVEKNNNINNVMEDIKRKPLNGKRTKIALVLAAIFMVYCIFILVKLLANPTDTIIVEQGKIYKEENVEGYIIRDESIVESDISSSNIICLKNEYDKVAKGEAIYRYALENEDELNEKIKALDDQIQEALKNETTFFSSDIKLLETQIETQLEDVHENTNMKELEQYKKNISNLITKKAKVAGELSPSNSYIQDLIKQRSNYETQVNSGSKYIYADRSGIISYKIDGLENSLSTGDFSYLNKKFLESLNLKSSQIIATSNTEAKIIDNFKCYITFISKTDEAINSNVGDSVKLRLPNTDEIKAEIVYKSNENDKEVLIVLEIKDSVESLVDYRKINFDVIWWSYSGIKIPNSAIQYDGDFAYVIRNKAGYEEKILVKILRQNDNYAIVDNYSSADLEEAGYDMNTLGTKKSIGIYDEIYVNNKK